MANELERGDGILWITVESYIVGDWYRDIKGTDSKIRYEDAPQNYLLNHLEMLRPEEKKVKTIWVEDKLRHSNLDGYKRKFRADIIVEYEDQVWLIEVKGHNAELTEVFDTEKCRKDIKCSNAVKQVRYYEKRIREMGWWKEKEFQKVVFWCHTTKIMESDKLPIKFDETKIWPKER